MTSLARPKRQTKRSQDEHSRNLVAALSQDACPTAPLTKDAASINKSSAGGQTLETRCCRVEGSHPPRSTRRRHGLRDDLRNPQPPRVCTLSSHYSRSRRGRRSDSGGLSAGFPQDSHLSRLSCLFLLAAPTHRQHCPHALPHEKARPSFSG